MNLLDFFRGKAVTIPPMDGALKPNRSLDEAALVVTHAEPDNLVADGHSLFFTAGAQLLELAHGARQARVVETFPAAITALAKSEDDAWAVALESGAVLVREKREAWREIASFKCPVALAFGAGQFLYLGNGSEAHPPSAWAHDLMAKGSSGSVWRLALHAGERERLADGLAFPFGIAVDHAGGRLLVSESWRHRVLAIPSAGGAPQPVLAKLPGYPGRISDRRGQGFLLCLFAPRNRLIELVLQEDAYRMDMMAEIPRDYWVAPALASGKTFLEPLQCGGVRTMGIHKPWSPSRSYGLVVELGADVEPIASHHSRADGKRHGIVSAVEWLGHITAAARGGDCIVRIAAHGGGEA